MLFRDAASQDLINNTARKTFHAMAANKIYFGGGVMRQALFANDANLRSARNRQLGAAAACIFLPL